MKCYNIVKGLLICVHLSKFLSFYSMSNTVLIMPCHICHIALRYLLVLIARQSHLCPDLGLGVYF